jgi:hypothetical protein
MAGGAGHPWRRGKISVKKQVLAELFQIGEGQRRYSRPGDKKQSQSCYGQEFREISASHIFSIICIRLAFA